MATFMTITVSVNNGVISADPSNQPIDPGTWDIFWIPGPSQGGQWSFKSLVFDEAGPFTVTSVQDQTVLAVDDNANQTGETQTFSYYIYVEQNGVVLKSADPVITNLSEG